MVTKICSACKQEKEIIEFSKNSHISDGYRSSCKQCIKIRNLRYKEKNKNTVKHYVIGTTKICSKCKIEKPINEFVKESRSSDGFRSDCKLCNAEYRNKNYNKRKIYFKQYHQKNQDKILERVKQYYQKNKDKIKEKDKQYRQKNKDKIREYSKQYRRENKDKILTNNKQKFEKIKNNQRKIYNINPKKCIICNAKIKFDRYYYYRAKTCSDECSNENKKILRNKYARKRYDHEKYAQRRQNDIIFTLKDIFRCRIRKAIKEQYANKICSSGMLLGISPFEASKYLESQFTPEMNWSNFGTYWHIDHIIACAAYDLSDQKEQKKCFNYRNLRPLNSKDNILKKDKLDMVLVKKYNIFDLLPDGYL